MKGRESDLLTQLRSQLGLGRINGDSNDDDDDDDVDNDDANDDEHGFDSNGEEIFLVVAKYIKEAKSMRESVNNAQQKRLMSKDALMCILIMVNFCQNLEI